MTHRRRAEWHALFASLSPRVQRLAERTFTRFRQNPHHPSLRFKKMRSQHQGYDCYEARVTRDYRAVAYLDGDTYVWFWIGTHNDFDSRF